MESEHATGLRNILRKDGPRWLVLSIDLFLVWFSFVFCYILLMKHRGTISISILLCESIVVSFIYLFVFLVFKPYQSIVRRTGLRDLKLIGNCIAVAFLVTIMASYLWEFIVSDELERKYYFSQTQLLFHALMTGIAMASVRLFYKTVYHSFFWNNRQNAVPVILFGAGNMGHNAYNLLQLGSRNRYKVVAILDDNPVRIGRYIQGIRIRSLEELDMNLLERIGGAQELVIAIDNSSPERLKNITARAELLPIKIKIIPNSAALLEGSVATQQIRALKVSDLLGRKPIELDNPIIKEALTGKVVLVTGGAGSIGAELVCQIGQVSCKLVVLDQAESALYDIQQELRGFPCFDDFTFIVGDVRDKDFMEVIFQQYRPQLIFHAAAYKHVPLMEANPYEAVWTNVFGSYNIALLADKYKVEKFVMVSTDKAVNPTNVMGATKRVAEIAVSAVNQVSSTAFIVTRFGNVLGSNGSVIPLFEKQIDKGGPITITHPDITRFFMTIPEACQLVQEAGIMGNGGEIYVFDMGEPVKIMDLAKQMIRLKGLRYPEDVDIKVVGLRPGEKIFEELLANDENTEKTHHEKIMIAKVNTLDVAEKRKKIDELCQLVQRANPEKDKMQIVGLVKAIVPEFRSQNSIFESLDHLKEPLN
ncbi:polysaccharide biosynthesis protein [Sphingobacterium prati]|uniref:polysaccharide biosynthesis protein n=1 Tax=Sphingobacterium prati TaxID=2737006 RepID=UPI0015553902|nr:nucleoside-diphosphate sugar epimerase/dehydratase [Sphingobacterium prati]NPE46757.1 polysaccharide biosynthesis protein [Sphingobacterium prati]